MNEYIKKSKATSRVLNTTYKRDKKSSVFDISGVARKEYRPIKYIGSLNNFVARQYYRPYGAAAASHDEMRQKQDAIDAMKKINLGVNQYFHCTTKKGYTVIGNMRGIDPAHGGKGGAGAALGGTLGAQFQLVDQGYSYASKDPNVIAEYFELNLAKAISTANAEWTPVILIISDIDSSKLKIDPQQAGAVRSTYGFAVDKRIFTGDPGF